MPSTVIKICPPLGKNTYNKHSHLTKHIINKEHSYCIFCGLHYSTNNRLSKYELILTLIFTIFAALKQDDKKG